PNLITSVYRALTEVERPKPPEVPLTPAVPLRQSIRQDYVVCLDCGHRRKTLRRHISSRHGLSADEYLKRWGLRQGHALTAPAYSEHRSALAKQLGLGRKPREAASEPAAASASAYPDGQVETTPRPRRTSRSRSRPEVQSEATSAPTRSR